MSSHFFPHLFRLISLTLPDLFTWSHLSFSYATDHHGTSPKRTAWTNMDHSSMLGKNRRRPAGATLTHPFHTSYQHSFSFNRSYRYTITTYPINPTYRRENKETIHSLITLPSFLRYPLILSTQEAMEWLVEQINTEKKDGGEAKAT